MKRQILCVSLLAFLLSSLACNQTPTVSGNTKSDVQTSENVSKEDKKEPIPDYDIDLGGEKFNILYFDPIQAFGWSSDIPCDAYAEEQSGDVLSDAVYERNLRVEDMYSLEIAVQKETQSVYSSLERSVMSQDGAYDAVFAKQSGFQSPVTKGYLAQLDDIIDLSKPWWDEKSREGFNVCGKTYAVAGDVIYMDKLSYITIFFNKNMVEEYKLGDIYKMVIDKEWTFEKMLQICELVSDDLNNNGKADKDDIFGFSGQNDATYEFYQSSGERFCSLDENGIPYMSNTSERAINILTKIATFMNDNKNFYNRHIDNLTVAETISMFTSDRVLFLMRPLQTIMELRAMQADFGIIPTPLMDETQEEYATSIGYTAANCIMIPIDAKNVQISAKVLDTLSADSYYNMNNVFYDMVLGSKLSRDDNSAENLDIIFDNVIYDPGCIFDFGNIASRFCTVISPDYPPMHLLKTR